MTTEDEIRYIQIRRIIEGLGWSVVSTEKSFGTLRVTIMHGTPVPPAPNTNAP